MIHSLILFAMTLHWPHLNHMRMFYITLSVPEQDSSESERGNLVFSIPSRSEKQRENEWQIVLVAIFCTCGYISESNLAVISYLNALFALPRNRSIDTHKYLWQRLMNTYSLCGCTRCALVYSLQFRIDLIWNPLPV